MNALCIYQYNVTQNLSQFFLWGVCGRWCGRVGTQEYGSIIYLYIEIMFRFNHHYTFKDLGHMDHSSLNITIQKSL